jgi:hypothetical protein
MITSSFSQTNSKDDGWYNFSENGDGPILQINLVWEKKDLGGAYVKFQVKEFRITSFRYEGVTYSNKDLEEVGIIFPVVDDHGAVNIKGNVAWSAGGRRETKDFTINTIGHFSDPYNVKFSDSFSEFVNKLYENEKGKSGAAWVKNGYISGISITGYSNTNKVGFIRNTIKKFIDKKNKEEQIESLIRKAKNYFNPFSPTPIYSVDEYDQALALLKEAAQIDPDNKEISKLTNQILAKRQKRKELDQKKEDDKTDKKLAESSMNSEYKSYQYSVATQQYRPSYRVNRGTGSNYHYQNNTDYSNLVNQQRRYYQQRSEAIQKMQNDLSTNLKQMSDYFAKQREIKRRKEEEKARQRQLEREREREEAKRKKERERELEGVERRAINNLLTDIELKHALSIENNLRDIIQFASGYQIQNYYDVQDRSAYAFVLEAIYQEGHYARNEYDENDNELPSSIFAHVYFSNTIKINPEKDGLYPFKRDILAEYINQTSVKKPSYKSSYSDLVKDEINPSYVKYFDRYSRRADHEIYLMVFENESKAKEAMDFINENISVLRSRPRLINDKQIKFKFENEFGTASKNATSAGIDAKIKDQENGYLINWLYSHYEIGELSEITRQYKMIALTENGESSDIYSPKSEEKGLAFEDERTYQDWRRFKFINVGMGEDDPKSKDKRVIEVLPNDELKKQFRRVALEPLLRIEEKIGKTNRTEFLKCIFLLHLGETEKSKTEISAYQKKYRDLSSTTTYQTLRKVSNYLENDLKESDSIDDWTDIAKINDYLKRNPSGTNAENAKNRRNKVRNYLIAKEVSQFDINPMLAYIRTEKYQTTWYKEIREKLYTNNYYAKDHEQGTWIKFYTIKVGSKYLDVAKSPLYFTINGRRRFLIDKSTYENQNLKPPQGWRLPEEEEWEIIGEKLYDRFDPEHFREFFTYRKKNYKRAMTYENSIVFGMDDGDKVSFSIDEDGDLDSDSWRSTEVAQFRLVRDSESNKSNFESFSFYDDFNNVNYNNWEDVSLHEKNTLYHFYESTGRRYFKNSSERGRFLFLNDQKLDFNRDWELNTAVQHESGKDNFFYGIWFNGSGATSNNTFLISNNGYFYIQIFIDGKKVKTVYKESDAIVKGDKEANLLKIIKSRKDVNFYINGVNIAEIPASNFHKSGDQLGFIVYNKQTVSFDFLSVKYDDK